MTTVGNTRHFEAGVGADPNGINPHAQADFGVGISNCKVLWGVSPTDKSFRISSLRNVYYGTLPGKAYANPAIFGHFRALDIKCSLSR